MTQPICYVTLDEGEARPLPLRHIVRALRAAPADVPVVIDDRPILAIKKGGVNFVPQAYFSDRTERNVVHDSTQPIHEGPATVADVAAKLESLVALDARAADQIAYVSFMGPIDSVRIAHVDGEGIQVSLGRDTFVYSHEEARSPAELPLGAVEEAADRWLVAYNAAMEAAKATAAKVLAEPVQTPDVAAALAFLGDEFWVTAWCRLSEILAEMPARLTALQAQVLADVSVSVTTSFRSAAVGRLAGWSCTCEIGSLSETRMTLEAPATSAVTARARVMLASMVIAAVYLRRSPKLRLLTGERPQ